MGLRFSSLRQWGLIFEAVTEALRTDDRTGTFSSHAAHRQWKLGLLCKALAPCPSMHESFLIASFTCPEAEAAESWERLSQGPWFGAEHLRPRYEKDRQLPR